MKNEYALKGKVLIAIFAAAALLLSIVCLCGDFLLQLAHTINLLTFLLGNLAGAMPALLWMLIYAFVILYAIVLYKRMKGSVALTSVDVGCLLSVIVSTFATLLLCLISVWNLFQYSASMAMEYFVQNLLSNSLGLILNLIELIPIILLLVCLLFLKNSRIPVIAFAGITALFQLYPLIMCVINVVRMFLNINYLTPSSLLLNFSSVLLSLVAISANLCFALSLACFGIFNNIPPVFGSKKQKTVAP